MRSPSQDLDLMRSPSQDLDLMRNHEEAMRLETHFGPRGHGNTRLDETHSLHPSLYVTVIHTEGSEG
ncbi:hypothetical protein EYF80_063603 [Liparis tanakae]|uniref:Uncharacterized protein n=1 Tax=Liparis tanakae TaxID=230148 RepID=A0A4Z2ECG8_9TELE|nr:hypothetical protein EYF80_063603 [Liparis tanakae]